MGIHVVYLSAYSARQRARELDELNRRLSCETGAYLVAGDFNLAPAPIDGLYGESPSTWSNATDRVPFQRLLADRGLVDLGSTAADHQFTFERIIRGVGSQFRCDLVLASASIVADLNQSYDHTIRVGEQRFTDHSAVIVTMDSAAPSHRRVPATSHVRSSA